MGQDQAKLARHDIRLYGFRVAEPNHCGCPHWHMLVFIPEGERELVREVISHYALEDSPNELGAEKHRVTFKAIDKSKGTAAGYIAKYIAKNIDGHALDCDIYGGDPIVGAERVDAWASCWGIRQFQQLGGPPVTVWRELRRMNWHEEGVLEAARVAADAGDWAAYVAAMGGPLVPRESLPVRPAYLQEVNTETGELPLNKYGEEAGGRMVGVQCNEVIYVTRWNKWEIGRGASKSFDSTSPLEPLDTGGMRDPVDSTPLKDWMTTRPVVAAHIARVSASVDIDGRPLVCPVPRGAGWDAFDFEGDSLLGVLSITVRP